MKLDVICVIEYDSQPTILLVPKDAGSYKKYYNQKPFNGDHHFN